MKKEFQPEIMIIGPFSGYDKNEIARAFDYYSELLASSGINNLNLWEFLRIQEKDIRAQKPHSRNLLSASNWRCNVEMRCLLEAFSHCNAIFIIPDLELCYQAKTLVSIAYVFGYEILKIQEGSPVVVEMLEDDVIDVYAGEPVEYIEDIGNVQVINEGEDDEGDDEDNDESDSQLEGRKSINHSLFPSEAHLEGVGNWTESQLGWKDDLDKPDQETGGGQNNEKK